MSEKVPIVISAALAGAITTKENNPNVPYTAEEFGDPIPEPKGRRLIFA